jgi:hypothetical protein
MGARFQMPGHNVVFPGTGHAPVARNPFSITDPGFARRLGSTVSGFPPLRPGFPERRHRFDRGDVALPVPYPVFVGGYPFGYPEPQAAPNITIVNTPPPTPQVVINQNFIPDGQVGLSAREYAPEDTVDESDVRIYEAPSRPSVETDFGSNRGHSYLVAFKDHSIYSAMAYWIEGDTLHYVTPHGVHNQASLDLIDREFTEQLNRERKLQVRIPRK